MLTILEVVKTVNYRKMGGHKNERSFGRTFMDVYPVSCLGFFLHIFWAQDHPFLGKIWVFRLISGPSRFILMIKTSLWAIIVTFPNPFPFNQILNHLKSEAVTSPRDPRGWFYWIGFTFLYWAHNTQVEFPLKVFPDSTNVWPPYKGARLIRKGYKHGIFVVIIKVSHRQLTQAYQF